MNLLPFDGLEKCDNGYWDIGVHKDGEEEQKSDFSPVGGMDFLPFAKKRDKSHQKHNWIREPHIPEQAFNHGGGVTPPEDAEEQGGDACEE